MATIQDIADEIKTATKRTDMESEILASVQRAVEFIENEYDWRWLEESSSTFTTSNGTESYSIESDIGVTNLKKIRELRYENSSANSEWPVNRKSQKEFRDKWGLNTSAGEPIEYMEDAGNIHLAPKPGGTYTVRFKYWKKHPTTAGTTLLVPSRNIVKEKALAIFFLDYNDMPELAEPHALEYLKELQSLFALETAGDEVVAVKYRDF